MVKIAIVDGGGVFAIVDGGGGGVAIVDVEYMIIIMYSMIVFIEYMYIHVFVEYMIIIMYSTLHYQCCSTRDRDSKSAAEYRGFRNGSAKRTVSGPLARRVGPLRWTADPPWLITMSYE